MTPLNHSESSKKVDIRCNGPYIVSGEIPLVQKTQVVSEYGEPLTWKKRGRYQLKNLITYAAVVTPATCRFAIVHIMRSISMALRRRQQIVVMNAERHTREVKIS